MRPGLNLTSIIDNIEGMNCPIEKEVISIDCVSENGEDFLDIDEAIENSLFNKATLRKKVRDYLKSIGKEFEENEDFISFPYKISNKRSKCLIEFHEKIQTAEFLVLIKLDKKGEDEIYKLCNNLTERLRFGKFYVNRENDIFFQTYQRFTEEEGFAFFDHISQFIKALFESVKNGYNKLIHEGYINSDEQ